MRKSARTNTRDLCTYVPYMCAQYRTAAVQRLVAHHVEPREPSVTEQIETTLVGEHLLDAPPRLGRQLRGGLGRRLQGEHADARRWSRGRAALPVRSKTAPLAIFWRERGSTALTSR